jgi:hypothetical protein
MLADLDMAKRHLGEVLSKIDPEDGQALSEFRKIKKLTKAQAQVLLLNPEFHLNGCMKAIYIFSL